MKVSIIIPLYNKANCIEKALKCIFLQTFGDWELIVVDDGSRDNSYELADNYLKGNGNNNCHLIHQDNAGVSIARNNGVLASKGEYLCFLDADDWWEPMYLREMMKFASQYSDAGLWACNYIYYKPGKIHIGVNHPTGYMNYPNCYNNNAGMPIWTGSVMMPRKVFDEMGGFPAGISLGEDFLLWSKIAHHYKIAFLDQPLAYYNNDFSVKFRATKIIHEPKKHMLWYVDSLITDDDWKRLIDCLRVKGLMDYWLNKDYHKLAQIELSKVDWRQQSKSIIRLYSLPIWFIKSKFFFMKFGSILKRFLRIP